MSGNQKKGLMFVKTKAMFVVLIVLIIIVAVLLNVMFSVLSKRLPLSIDMTGNNMYTLGNESKALIKSLDSKVNIYILAIESEYQSTSGYSLHVSEILKQYPRYSDNIEVSYIDIIQNPTFTANYPNLQLAEGNILICSGDKVKAYKTSDFFTFGVNDEGNVVVSSQAESVIATAILGLTSEQQENVLILTGNGAQAPDGLINLLAGNNYAVSEVNLSMDTPDKSAKFALLIAPTMDLSDAQIDKLEEFLYNGGKYGKTLFYAADAGQTELPNFEGFLREWGISVENGIVFETSSSKTYNFQPFYAAVEITDDEYGAETVSGTQPLIMPEARPLLRLFEFQDNYYTSILTQFSETSGVRPSNAPSNFSIADSTMNGPIPAMILASYIQKASAQEEQRQSNIVVSGSTVMLDSAILNSTEFSNAAYVLKLFNRLCGREGLLINLVNKQISVDALSVKTSTANTIGVISIFVLPGIIVLFGMAVWLRRRHK